jgi:copper ion binding protein
MNTSIETYAVVGMSCQHCIDAVTAEVGRIPGVEQVDVDLTEGRVRVTSEAPLDPAAVRDAIDEAGFELAGAGPAT